jgi:flagellar biosynthesis protein FliQ
MNAEVALYWVQQSLETSIMVLGPLLGAALAIGLVVSIFQAVTSMQEMTLSFIPKLLVVAVVLFLLAPWMLQVLVDFTTHAFTAIPTISQ